MPFISVETNIKFAKTEPVMRELSRVSSAIMGKPESVFQLSIKTGTSMLMAGTGEPTAFVRVRGINIPESQTQPLTEAICGVIQNLLSIPGNRVYVEFISSKNTMWGFDGNTF